MYNTKAALYLPALQTRLNRQIAAAYAKVQDKTHRAAHLCCTFGVMQQNAATANKSSSIELNPVCDF
jgi:hypothetical protein